MSGPTHATAPKRRTLSRFVRPLQAAWAAVPQKVFWAIALPALSMRLADDQRDLYLLAYESSLTLAATIYLLRMALGRGATRRAWQWALVLFGLGSADLIYNMPGPLLPRYPRNHVADLVLIVVIVALIGMAARGWQRRRQLASTYVVFGVALVTLKLECVYVLGPFTKLPFVPTLAIFNGWLYACACSILLGLLLVRSGRAIQDEEHLAAQGLLLMLASDFAQRHDSLTTVGAMGWGEAGWAAGLGLLVVALTGRQGQLPWRASSPEAPWLSVRCALGAFTFFGNLILLVGALVGGLLQVTEGAHLTALLWPVWISWFLSNLLALRLHRTMERIGSLVPAPQITWCTDQHPVTVALKPIRVRLQLSEFDGWIARYNHLVRRLNPLIAQASRHHETFAYQRLAEHVAHDIRAPIAALHSALEALADRTEPSTVVLRDAATRVHEVASTLLEARRGMGHAHPGQTSHPEGLAPGPSLAAEAPAHQASIDRALQLVQRDLRLRHGALWARHITWPTQAELYVTAPMHALVTVLTNLINNSIEATVCAPGNIEVAVQVQRDMALIEISDKGCGMPREVLHALGERSITAGKPQGNGLGVLGAAQAARAWGGTLRYRLPSQGGTVATLSLPIAESSSQPARAAQTLETRAEAAVLVDDDPLVRAAWQLSAARAQQLLVTFSTAQACLDALDGMATHTPFYLDTQLGGALTGHDLAQKLIEAGFKNIVVMQSQGGGASDQLALPHTKSYPIVSSKRAPFTRAPRGAPAKELGQAEIIPQPQASASA